MTERSLPGEENLDQTYASDESGVYERYGLSTRSRVYDEYIQQNIPTDLKRKISCSDFSKSLIFWLVILLVVILTGLVSGLVAFFVLEKFFVDKSSCTSWESWDDSSSCLFDPVGKKGFRLRTRCCSTNLIGTCIADQDVMECTPRECINIQCNCNSESEAFGLRNGICSSGNNLGQILNPDCGCVEEDCSSECTVLTKWSAWTDCRVLDTRSCSGPGLRRKSRICENGCDEISNNNLTITEPCDVTECPNAVLVLSTLNRLNVPIIVDFEGKYDSNFDFKYGDETSAADGCGVTYMGEFWYFGDKTLVSKVIGCQLVKQKNMEFNFSHGSCNTFMVGKTTSKVLLCFDEDDDKQCRLFDGEEYLSIGLSKYSHIWTLGLANYRGKALTTGCNGFGECSFKTELLDMTTLRWSDGDDFPFGDREKFFAFYSTAETIDTAYFFGGQDIDSKIAAQFNNDIWQRLPDLKRGRYGHGSILVGDTTLVIGGWARESEELATEVWTYEDGKGEGRTIEPSLDDGDYRYGIGLYAVDFDFCRI